MCDSDTLYEFIEKVFNMLSDSSAAMVLRISLLFFHLLMTYSGRSLFVFVTKQFSTTYIHNNFGVERFKKFQQLPKRSKRVDLFSTNSNHISL